MQKTQNSKATNIYRKPYTVDVLVTQKVKMVIYGTNQREVKEVAMIGWHPESPNKTHRQIRSVSCSKAVCKQIVKTERS